MAAWTTYLHLLAFVLAAYWLHAGYRALLLRGRQATFRIEQRRKAGIPDSDTRPFHVAQADAAQRRRQRELERRSRGGPARPSAPSPQAVFGRRLQKASASPTVSRSFSPPRPRSSPEIRSRQHPEAGHSGAPDSPAVQATHLLESRDGIYAPKALDPTRGMTPGRGDRNPDSKWTSGGSIDQLSRSQQAHPPPSTHEEDSNRADGESQAGSEMTWETDSAVAAPQAVSRGIKRTAADARSAADAISITARRRSVKRGRTQQPSEWMEEDSASSDHSDAEASDGGVLSASSNDHEEMDVDADEDVEVPRRPATMLPRPAKPARLRHRKSRKQRGSRSLRDEMMNFEQSDGSEDDTTMVSASGRSPGSGPPRAEARADISDSDRQVGEEWKDNASGTQWRMDQDEVETEEETPSGRKRRVTVSRKVKRRLTVKKEWRPKWEMPADSLHPDKAEMVPHYVPVWLSDSEFSAAQANGELGSQVGGAGNGADPGAASSPARSPRSLDMLFHQPANLIPLRSSMSSSRLGALGHSAGTGHLSPQLRRSRSSTPDTLLSPASGRSAGKSGRLSLAGVAGSTSDSPMRGYVLDSAAKRRREEELIKRLRQSKEASQPSPAQAVVTPTSRGQGKTVSFDLPGSSAALPSPSPSTGDQGLAAANSKSLQGPTASLNAQSGGGASLAPPPAGVSHSSAQSQGSASSLPASATTPSTTEAPSKVFSFGNGSSTGPDVKSQTGNAPTPPPSSMPAGGFTFGASSAPAPSSGSTTPAKAGPTFTFGANASAGAAKAETASNVVPPAQASSSLSSQPSFTFANNTTSHHATPGAAQSKPSFTFAAPKSQPSGEPGTSQAPKFTFGSGSGSPAPSGGFTFGAKK
ncbi:unnamed protein product [Parajaminaea phylloscopi]